MRRCYVVLMSRTAGVDGAATSARMDEIKVRVPRRPRRRGGTRGGLVRAAARLFPTAALSGLPPVSKGAMVTLLGTMQVGDDRDHRGGSLYGYPTR